MENKFLSFLGMGKKAGYLTVGETGCEISIKKGKAKLIIVAGDSSENTIKKFRNMTTTNGIDMIITSTKDNLGRILGKNLVAVISVNDEKFTKALIEKLDVT